VGTSTSYGGPTGRNPLLPPGAPDPAEMPSGGPDGPADEGLPIDQIRAPFPSPEPWRGAKTAMRRLAASGARNDDRVRDVGRRFVNSLGGSRRAAASSVAARSTARSLGGFLSGVARDGIIRTLERLGLRNFVGQSVPALLTALGRILAPASATADEAIAATAYHETMAELIDELGVTGEDLAAFDQMDEIRVRETMERYVGNVVLTRLLQVLSAEIEQGAVTPERAVAVELELRDFVKSAVALEFGQTQITTVDWDSPAAARVIDSLFRQGYDVFGGRR
jgi:hypothetical protein